ncbi:hypothetical protein VOLCADRAFT_88101 [Volvox carteri f. nagariensis]|uniref:HTH HARE-type domain-containing protein n=1 Tax=Volvox carteri f. nagariensis TaxID=3068 RepID=D8TN30_VOLCA|nr:uncharacterized protein VOLCADRAFT_88101 [Volvox carteri f. nagariensis]EFJ51231.1 hypothetical protein VOLCADRAFT_88101 [Volvox carteri f. nagariensis]|eukprot:XP_002947698.1 hypothetical protein VOLCADRAFT_88101 [Volvox carteri f. nagariensis]
MFFISSRRNMYSGDFDTESGDHASGAPVTGGIFKNAAFEILKQEERLMTSGEITKLAIDRKLLRCMGKTPENTMASALYTEVRKKAHTTVFIKPKEGLFGLKSWLNEPWLLNWLAQEGIDLADLHDPGGAQEPVPKKLRTSYNGAPSRAGAVTGGGGYYSNRTSSNGAPLLRSSSAGMGTSLGVPAAVTAAGHRGSLSAGDALGSGGGSRGGRGSFTSFGPAPSGNGGAIPKVPYGGGRGVTANGMAAAGAVAGGNSAGGAVSDALSSLHLLVDAADEIEGGPEDDPAVMHGPPQVRRRSGDVHRQPSFRRQRPPLSREPSMPCMVAKVRMRDELEDDRQEAPEGEEEGEEEMAEGEEEGEKDAGRVAEAAAFDDDGEQGEESDGDMMGQGDGATAAAVATYRRDAVLALQLRQQSSNQLHRTAEQQRQQHTGRAGELAEEASDDRKSEEQQHIDDGPEHGQPSEGNGEDAANHGTPAGVRWGPDAENLGHHHPGIYRGMRGGRISGRTILGDNGAAGIAPAAVGGGRRRHAHRPGVFGAQAAGRGEETDEDEGREAEEEDEGQEEEEEDDVMMSGDETVSAQRRRTALPPRSAGSDRRTGADSGGGGGARRQVRGGAQRCSASSRKHSDVPLPPHFHGRRASRSMPPMPQSSIPMMHMPPGQCLPLHLLQGLPPQGAAAATAGLPYNPAAVHAMLVAGGGGVSGNGHGIAGGLPLPSSERLRAVLMGGGPLALPGLGLGLGPGQLSGPFGPMLGPQMLPPGLGMGLPGLDVGALLGDMPANLATAVAGGGGAASGGTHGYPLPPSLAQIAAVLGRSPGLSASFVAAHNRIAEMSGAAAELNDNGGRGGVKTGRDAVAVAMKFEERGGGGSGSRPSASRQSAADGEERHHQLGGGGGGWQLGKGGTTRRAAKAPLNSYPGGGGASSPQSLQMGADAAAAATAGVDGAAAGGGSSSRSVFGDGGEAAAACTAGFDQHQQQVLEEVLLRAPSSVSPMGGPPAASVAVHDAMNSPDSQLAGGAGRASPVNTDGADRHSLEGESAGQLDNQPTAATGAAGAASASASGGPQRRPAAQASGVAAPPGPQPCSSSGGRQSAVAAAAAAGAEQAQGLGPQVAGGNGEVLAQLALLQQQHLKLLLPVDAARQGDVPDPASINRIRQQVLETESRMGPLHPETGRAYVLLARVLEHKGTCWSLSMAERALLRAWTIVSLVSSSRRPSDLGSTVSAAAAPASAVSGAVEADAAEGGTSALGEMLGQLPDSFHSFQYLLEQIRMKLSFLQDRQERQLVALLRMVAMLRASPGGKWIPRVGLSLCDEPAVGIMAVGIAMSPRAMWLSWVDTLSGLCLRDGLSVLPIPLLFVLCYCCCYLLLLATFVRWLVHDCCTGFATCIPGTARNACTVCVSIVLLSRRNRQMVFEDLCREDNTSMGSRKDMNGKLWCTTRQYPSGAAMVGTMQEQHYKLALDGVNDDLEYGGTGKGLGST